MQPVHLHRVNAEANVARLSGPLLWLSVLSLAVGILLAVMLSRTIKKILFGLELNFLFALVLLHLT